MLCDCGDGLEGYGYKPMGVKVCQKPSGLRKKHGADSLLEPLIGNNSVDTLILKRASILLVQMKS